MAQVVEPGTGLEVATDAVARAIKAGADAARVIHSYSEAFEVNFDTDDVTLVRSTVSDSLSITALSDTRRGSTVLSGRTHDAVERGVEEALQAAHASSPDPANVLPEADGGQVADHGEEVPDKDGMIDAVLRHIGRVREEYPDIRTDSSHYSLVSTWSTYADSNDRVQHARRNHYQLMLLVAGKRDTASTSFNVTMQAGLEPLGELTDLVSVRRVFDNTMATFDARPVPSTFVGDVIFTPEALDTLTYTLVGALSGMSLYRKTSPFLDCLGAAVAVPQFSLLHRPDEIAVTAPFDGDGFAARDLDIVRDGVLQDYIVDWYFSQKLGRPMTTGSTALVVPPGTTSLDDVIAGTERGIVLGRFSGGSPDPKLDFSGVAKNSFYVEDGKIVHPITETMIAGNFRDALTSIRAISRETIDFGTSRNPWVSVGGITISTK
jgi:PmbA protein